MAIKSKILKITLIVLACIVLIPVLLVVVSLIWTAVTDPLTCLEEGCYASSQTAQYEDESRGIYHSITDFSITLTPVSKSEFENLQQDKIYCRRCRQRFKITFTAAIDGENTKLEVLNNYVFYRNGFIFQTRSGEEPLFFEVFFLRDESEGMTINFLFLSGDVVMTKTP